MIANHAESYAEESDDEVVVGLILQETELAGMNFLKCHDNTNECTESEQSPSRPCRKTFDAVWAWKCIQYDYLGPDALFGKEFSMMFHSSRPHFSNMMEDIMQQNIRFYYTTETCHGRKAASCEARLHSL